jgi:electron transfer flavoprotein alpha subunit
MSAHTPQGGAVNGEVWVWLARDREGRLTPAAGEALYEGGALARRLGAQLMAVSDRSPDPAELRLLGVWGVAAVRTLSDKQPPHPLISAGRSPLVALAGDAPAVTLFPGDAFGQAVAPLWAAECGAVYVPAATGITSNGRALVLARPTHGGNFEAIVTLPLDTAVVATLRPGAVGEVAPTPPGAAPPHLLAPAPRQEAPSGGTPVDVLAPDPAALDVADAERIVCFGRGAFSREAVALVERLAALLGATVAGTRPAADEGWLPFSRQVGLTGAIVTPKLYVAVGLSGAPYHMAGVKEPETLIAINSDPEAPILAAAHLGIVGDLHAVLPALISRLEQGRAIAVPGKAAVGKA